MFRWSPTWHPNVSFVIVLVVVVLVVSRISVVVISFLYLLLIEIGHVLTSLETTGKNIQQIILCAPKTTRR